MKKWPILGVLAILLLASFVVVFVRATTPAPPVHYARQLHEHVLSRQMELYPEAQDRWEDLVGELVAIEPLRLPASGAGAVNSVLEPLLSDAPAPEELARARQFFNSLEGGGIFDAAARMASIQVAARPVTLSVDEPMMTLLLPELTQVRFLAAAQRARIAIATNEGGDPDDRVAALRETLALARLVSWQGSMIDALVAGRVASEAAALTIETVRSHPIEDEEWFEAADRALADAQAGWAPLTHALDCERLFILDALQRVHSRGGRFLPRAASEQWSSGESSREMAQDYRGPLSESEAWLERIMSAARAAIEASGQEIVEADEAYENVNDELIQLGVGPDQKWPAIQYVRGAYAQAIGQDRHARITLAGTRVVLAIERHRLTTGQLPESIKDLGELLPSGLEADPVTEQPWAYERTDAGYTLASRALPGYEAEEDTEGDPLAGVVIAP